MQPRGATLFYTAVHSCVEDLFSNASVNEQWVIALTDGETNFSSESRQYHAIMEHLSQRNRCPLNLVCIIVGPNSQSHLVCVCVCCLWVGFWIQRLAVLWLWL